MSCAIINKENNFAFFFQIIVLLSKFFFKKIGSHSGFVIGFVVDGQFFNICETPQLLEFTYGS